MLPEVSPATAELAKTLAVIDRQDDPDYNYYAAAEDLIRRNAPKPKARTDIPLVRSREWLAKAEFWKSHIHSPWTKAAKRNKDGVHLGYVTVERPYWSAYDQIRVNTDDWINFLVVDIDHPDAMTIAQNSPVPPSSITRTPHGAHVSWMIDPVYKNPRMPKAHLYALTVLENLRRLLGGDPSFSNSGMRNPAFSGHETIWGDMRVWSLGGLRAGIGDAWSSDVVRKTDTTPGDGRNTNINRELWRWANKHPARLDELEVRARMLNSTAEPTPLDPDELACIVRSVRSGMGRKRRGAGEAWISKEDAAKGGRTRVHAVQDMAARSAEVRAQKSNVLRKRAQSLRAEGVSTVAIAKELGISQSQASRLSRSAPTAAETTAPHVPTTWGLLMHTSDEHTQGDFRQGGTRPRFPLGTRGLVGPTAGCDFAVRIYG